MLQNANFIAKIGADTAENERNFAENLPKIGNYPTCWRVLRRRVRELDRGLLLRHVRVRADAVCPVLALLLLRL